MNLRIALILPVGLALGALVAMPQVRAADAGVIIDNFTFTPATINVAVGTKVTWTEIPHTVTDADHPKNVKPPPLDTGDAYSRVFTITGTYHYFCFLHPHMQGTVVVK